VVAAMLLVTFTISLSLRELHQLEQRAHGASKQLTLLL
jgi:hypothetical protein